MDAWQLESKEEITKEHIKELLKKKREKDTLKKLKSKHNG